MTGGCEKSRGQVVADRRLGAIWHWPCRCTGLSTVRQEDGLFAVCRDQYVNVCCHPVATVQDGLNLARAQPCSQGRGQQGLVEPLHSGPEMPVDVSHPRVRHLHVGSERARVIDQAQAPSGVDQPVPLIRVLRCR